MARRTLEEEEDKIRRYAARRDGRERERERGGRLRRQRRQNETNKKNQAQDSLEDESSRAFCSWLVYTLRGVPRRSQGGEYLEAGVAESASPI